MKFFAPLALCAVLASGVELEAETQVEADAEYYGRGYGGYRGYSRGYGDYRRGYGGYGRSYSRGYGRWY